MLAAIVLAGCGGNEANPSASPQPARVAPPPPPPPPPVPVTKAPEMIEKKAEAGVGEKGHYDSNAVVTVLATPISSYFNMRERIAFDIQLPEAMKLFKASEDRAPKSHEEFMERIIKEQHINLPTLPEGHRYKYDPKTEQLMVEQPAPK
jgi:hypothetical protein